MLNRDALERYSRHILLPEIGRAGQERLVSARVLIVGAGGLGSPAALYLAAAGVGFIAIADDDTVADSNLQRQILFDTDGLGDSKSGRAAERLRALNPYITVTAIRERITSANALDLLDGVDLVLDGSDNFPTRYLLNDACVPQQKPLIHGSVYRFEGQVSRFHAPHGPCYRCLYPEPPPPEMVPGCGEGGVLGVLTGIVGSLQALEAIKALLGIGDPLLGRLVMIDGLGGTQREIAFGRNPDCPVCGEHPTLRTLIDYEAFCGVALPDDVPALEAEALRDELRGEVPPLLVDVREPGEHELCRLPGEQVLIPLRELTRRMEELDGERPLVVYCRTGVRSARAVAMLRQAGRTEVLNLAGGIMAWADRIDPSLPRY